jgi:hypothetical protein
MCQYWWCETILQFLCMQPISLLFCNTDLSFELKKCFPYWQATLHISQVLSQMKFQLLAYFEHYKTFQIFHRLFIIISALNNKGFARFTVLNFQIRVALYSSSGEKKMDNWNNLYKIYICWLDDFEVWVWHSSRTQSFTFVWSIRYPWNCMQYTS